MDKSITDLGPAYRGIDGFVWSRRVTKYLSADGLSAAETLLMQTVASYYKPEDKSWPFPSYATLAADLGYGKDGGKLVGKMLRDLQARGFIKLTPSGHGGGKPIPGSSALTSPTNAIDFSPLLAKVEERAWRDPEHRKLVEVEGLKRLQALAPDFAHDVAKASGYRFVLNYPAINAWAVQLMLDGDDYFAGVRDPAAWDDDHLGHALDVILEELARRADEHDEAEHEAAIERAIYERELRDAAAIEAHPDLVERVHAGLVAAGYALKPTASVIAAVNDGDCRFDGNLLANVDELVARAVRKVPNWTLMQGERVLRDPGSDNAWRDWAEASGSDVHDVETVRGLVTDIEITLKPDFVTATDLAAADRSPVLHLVQQPQEQPAMTTDQPALDLARVRSHVQDVKMTAETPVFTDAALLAVADRVRPTTPAHMELEHAVAVQAVLDAPRRQRRRRFATASRRRDLMRHAQRIARNVS